MVVLGLFVVLGGSWLDAGALKLANGPNIRDNSDLVCSYVRAEFQKNHENSDLVCSYIRAEFRNSELVIVRSNRLMLD